VIAHHSLSEGAEFSPLAHHRFVLDQSIHLENGYYQPTPGQPTFNSFVYDKGTQTATMLQMTVATCHDTKARGVEWLLNQSAQKICLVAVIPPGTSLDLSIPNSLTHLFLNLC
jgi:hypothetical protein